MTEPSVEFCTTVKAYFFGSFFGVRQSS
jgi:hypothetical protein